MTAAMQAREPSRGTLLRVIDALDHPHGGRILRVRAEGDAPPKLRDLRGAELTAVSVEGEQRTVRVLDLPVSGGMQSDERIRRTGRVDLRVEELGEGIPVSTTWVLHPSRD